MSKNMPIQWRDHSLRADVMLDRLGGYVRSHSLGPHGGFPEAFGIWAPLPCDDACAAVVGYIIPQALVASDPTALRRRLYLWLNEQTEYQDWERTEVPPWGDHGEVFLHITRDRPWRRSALAELASLGWTHEAVALVAEREGKPVPTEKKWAKALASLEAGHE